VGAHQLADALGGHGALPATYLETIRALRVPAFAGFLTGSIDLVFRAWVDGAPTWFVADYKTNRVDTAGTGRVTDANFTPGALQRAMEHAHYLLQATLYMLALRRYLRARGLKERVGGAYYCFLRGMRGPDTPRYGDALGGVYHLPASEPVMDALDALLQEIPAP
jgi:exodeoxyribonuclease V beta subunit